MPPKGPGQLQQTLDQGIWTHGGGDQTEASRRMFALEELGRKQRLTKDAEIELSSLGLADDDVAVAKGERSSYWKPSTRTIDSEYAVKPTDS
jgi:hypothetical protein